MLKITIMETTSERRWIVQGRLVGPWVSELRTTWKRPHRTPDKRACIIDLNTDRWRQKFAPRRVTELANLI
jgi:hypothetical protein